MLPITRQVIWTVVSVITQTTAPGEMPGLPVHWIRCHLERRSYLTIRLLDVRCYPLPPFDPARLRAKPRRLPPELDAVVRWAEQVAASDAFIVATPRALLEATDALHAAFDWGFAEWARKPVGFVSWGDATDPRNVHQLRELAIERRMVPLRTTFVLPQDVVATDLPRHRTAAEQALTLLITRWSGSSTTWSGGPMRRRRAPA